MNPPQTIAPPSSRLRADLDLIATMADPDAIKAELRRLAGLTVEAVVKIGALLVRLEEIDPDADLSEFRYAALNIYRRVGHGQLVAELVVMLAGATLLATVMRLPLADQRRIAEGQPLRIMQRNGDTRTVPLLLTNAFERRQLFAHDHLRTDAEQAAYLRAVDERWKTTTKPIPAADTIPITLDRRRRGIHVGARFIPVADLAHYLAVLSEDPKTKH